MKKVGKIFLYIILALVLTFVLIGQLAPKSHTTTVTVEINKPVQDCWQIFNNDSLKKNWMQGLMFIINDQNRTGKGAIDTLVYRGNEGQEDMQSKLVRITRQWQPYDSLETEYDIRPIALRKEKVVFKTLDSNTTQIIVESELFALKRMARIMFYGSEKGNNKLKQDELNKFKNFIENI